MVTFITKIKCPNCLYSCYGLWHVGRWCLILNKHFVFDWCMFGYESNKKHGKDMRWGKIGPRVQNLLTILDVNINMITHTLGPTDHLITQIIFILDNKLDVHTSSKNYEGSGYGHDLDLLIILHWSCALYFTRSGCIEKVVCSLN